ncbi:MAG: glycosyltransferase [Planctomycetes bacterium]|nr:glycosyltransferase [Planctomycetota bacterium]
MPDVELMKLPPLAQAAQRALAWVKANTLESGGVIVSPQRREAYQEVTGYLIPTLLDLDETVLASRYASYLIKSQRVEGAWGLGDKPYLFDTAQIAEGLTAAALRHPGDTGVRESLRRAVDWARSRIDARGLFDAADHDAGISEQVHLRSVRNLHIAARALGDTGAQRDFEKVARNYLRRAECLNPDVLSHFHAYELDGVAYFQPGRALVALREVASRQRPDGAIAAFPGRNWVCNPGVAQYAILFCQFGMIASARRALRYLAGVQAADGGFTGGDGEYFPDAEISWVPKFYLDAHNILTRQEALLAVPQGSGAETAQSPRRLLVIPEQRLNALGAGYDGEYLSRYFNPADEFAEVRLFNWGFKSDAWPGLKHGVLDVPRDGSMEAWMDTLALSDGGKPLTDDGLKAGFTGIPESWLAAVRAYNPDCIRAYGARWSGFVAKELGRALHVPVVLSVHNVTELATPVLRDANVIAVSDETARACIDAGASPARVTTINNRVDRERFKPDAGQGDQRDRTRETHDVSREGLPGAPSGAPKLLSVARDVPQKNLDRLIAACELARKSHPGLRLVHIGASKRDWDRIPFATHFDSVPHERLARWYGWADALVLPSLWEGFGIVIAEALACGTPVITSNRAPMNAIVHDKWDGLLVDPENVGDIARAIGEFADAATQLRLAAPARAASEPYDIALIEARESALYRSITSPQAPLVSVVLPTFNRGRLIESAVRNVLAQDYQNLELIVVNDGSKDDTASVLERLVTTLQDTRLRVIHKQNTGLPAALNTGFEHARGELLTWTSDDNAFKPGALDAMARELALDPEAAMVFADYELFDSRGEPIKTMVTGPVSELTSRNVIGACFMYRRQTAQKVGAYDGSLELAEDYDYWLRLSRVGKLIHLNRVLYDYGDTPDSLTNRRFADVTAATVRLNEREGVSGPELRLQLARLAGEYKSRGMPLKSLSAAAKLVARWPLSGAGYWAFARALVPLPILRLTRRARGADA